MFGYFKWVIMKYKKVIIDFRCVKFWVKFIKNIEVVVKFGGFDFVGNLMFFDVVQKVKKILVLKDNIDCVVKCGVGIGGEVVEYILIMYEGYGFNGVVFMIECLIDNKNCVVVEVCMVFSCNGGMLVDFGSVVYNFSCKGVIVVGFEGMIEDDVMMVVFEVGVEEIEFYVEGFEIIMEVIDFVVVCSVLQEVGIDYELVDVEFVLNFKVEIDVDMVCKIFCFIDVFEDSEDVQNVFMNFDLIFEVQVELENDDVQVCWSCVVVIVVQFGGVIFFLCVFGIDLGFIWCGVGIVDVDCFCCGIFVYVGVICLVFDVEIGDWFVIVVVGICFVIVEYCLDVVVVECVFVQQNIYMVMGMVQVSGVVLLIVFEYGFFVVIYMLSEVKVVVIGYGLVDK